MSLKVLILDQGRQALPFIKSFSNSGYEVICVCNSRLNEVYFSRYPSKKLIWPSYIKEKSRFEDVLINYLKNNKIDVTIGLGDISAEILSKNKETIQKYTKLTIPDFDTFHLATDKLKLMNYCMENEIQCPKTYDLTEDNIERISQYLTYPVIVKPRKGVGAIGLTKIYNLSELKAKTKNLQIQYGPLLVQEYIPQEDGMQYQAEAFLDRNSELRVCMVISKPRFFPVTGGTSSANVTIENNDILETSKALLQGINWIGAADVDFIFDPRDKKIKVLEINPRVTAGIKIGFKAGIDYADLHVKMALNKSIPKVEKYKLGIYCRNIYLEILWYLFSTQKMKKGTSPPFFKFYGRNICDQVFSIYDPLTGFGFLANLLKKYINPVAFKRKFGLLNK